MAAQSDGDRDLIERRENIRLLNDETSMKLKKQVYLNYRQVRKINCFSYKITNELFSGTPNIFSQIVE